MNPGGRSPLALVREWLDTRRREVVDAVWFSQPDAVRVQVEPSRRPETRRELERARLLLRGARAAAPGTAQNALGAAALHVLLAELARAAVPTSRSETPNRPAADLASDTAATREGAVRVAATLARPVTRDALAAFGDPDRAPPGDEVAFHGLVELCAWTESLIDVRSKREQKARRLAGAIGATVALIAAAHALLAEPNLALGKTVTASSLCPFMPAPVVGQDRLGRLVNGVRVESGIVSREWSHGMFAVCTEVEVHPWITIDLGAEKTISRVVVYNRADCCWGVDDLPVSLQLSNDNSDFTTVVTRSVPFRDDFPWHVEVGGKRARYVRLYGAADAPRNLVYGEVEIYGR